jgi:hypothetical protein
MTQDQVISTVLVLVALFLLVSTIGHVLVH